MIKYFSNLLYVDSILCVLNSTTLHILVVCIFALTKLITQKKKNVVLDTVDIYFFENTHLLS